MRPGEITLTPPGGEFKGTFVVVVWLRFPVVVTTRVGVLLSVAAAVEEVVVLGWVRVGVVVVIPPESGQRYISIEGATNSCRNDIDPTLSAPDSTELLSRHR